MRITLVAALMAALCLTAPVARAAPDASFTASMYDYVEAKKNEFLAEIEARGRLATPEDVGQAYCRSVMWWKMANPGGEARLTLEGLISLRRMEVLCGQRMRRAPVRADERQTPPRTVLPIPTGGTRFGAAGDATGEHEAVEDFMRWHPGEFESAPTPEAYARLRLLWWHVLGEGYRLLEAVNAAAAGAAGPAPVAMSGEARDQWERDVEAAARRAQEAYESAAAEVSRQAVAEWHERNPEALDPALVQDEEQYVGRRLFHWLHAGEGFALAQAASAAPSDRNASDAFAAAEAAQVEAARAAWRAHHGNAARPEHSPSEHGFAEVLRAAAPAGIVLPHGHLPDVDQWTAATSALVIGANDEVGAGARRRQQALGAAAGAVSGALGIGGGRRSDSGPPLARCRIDRDAVQRFENGDVALDLAAHRSGDTLTVFADIARAPDSGTFQGAMLRNQYGELLAPSNVEICELYGQWRLTVSWTRTTYRDGRRVAQERGGWSEQGRFGLRGDAGDATQSALWRQLGFSHASHGAKHVALTFDLPETDARAAGAMLIAHITRPGEDPVRTTPLALMVELTNDGVRLAEAP